MKDNHNHAVIKISSHNILDIMGKDPQFKIEFTNGLVNNIANHFVKFEEESFKDQIRREVQNIICGAVIDAKIGFVSSIVNHTESIKLKLNHAIREEIKAEVVSLVKDIMDDMISSGVKKALDDMKPGIEEFFDNSVRDLAVSIAVKNANDAVRQAFEEIKRNK